MTVTNGMDEWSCGIVVSFSFYFHWDISQYLEPGFYEDGNFGIRIENQMIVKKVDTPFQFNNTQYLGFETTTYV
jgi:hypothetical protein